MSDLHGYSKPNSSVRVLTIVTIIVLALLYFLAKGCTNHSKSEAAPASHHASSVVAPQQQMLL